jgi:hypothetical protein
MFIPSFSNGGNKGGCDRVVLSKTEGTTVVGSTESKTKLNEVNRLS